MSIIDSLLGLLAPYDCLNCAAEGQLVCTPCISSIGQPTRVALSPALTVRAATTYQVLAKEVVWQLKSSGAQPAAKLMASMMRPLLPIADTLVLVPVPTATSRIRQRGYDQAKLIVRELSRQARLPILHCLVRLSQSDQVGASRQTRTQQLTDAFRTKGSLRQDNHYVLIDDVSTTGATLLAAAACLREAGAESISALVFAQTPRYH